MEFWFGPSTVVQYCFRLCGNNCAPPFSDVLKKKKKRFCYFKKTVVTYRSCERTTKIRCEILRFHRDDIQKNAQLLNIVKKRLRKKNKSYCNSCVHDFQPFFFPSLIYVSFFFNIARCIKNNKFFEDCKSTLRRWLLHVYKNENCMHINKYVILK